MTGRCGAGAVCPTGAEVYPAACPVHEPNGCESPVTAPSPAAAGLPAEDVERVARAIAEAEREHVLYQAQWCSCGWRVPEGDPMWLVRAHEHRLRTSAVAALTATRTSPDSGRKGQ